MFVEVAGEHEPAGPILVLQLPLDPSLLVLDVLSVDTVIIWMDKVALMHNNIMVIYTTMYVL